MCMCVCLRDRARNKVQKGEGGSGVDSLTPKYLSESRIKSKKDKNGPDNRDPLITEWGRWESERGAGTGPAGGLPCCLPKSLPNPMCLCQPTNKKKKNSHNQILDSQLPWPKNNNSPLHYAVPKLTCTIHFPDPYPPFDLSPMATISDTTGVQCSGLCEVPPYVRCQRCFVTEWESRCHTVKGFTRIHAAF